MNNKNVGFLSLGLTYAGCFFGAGFVSGQELWQFFGAFGIYGYLGILLTIILFFVFGVMLVRSTQLSQKAAFDEVIIINNHKKLRFLLGLTTVFLMFGVIVIMCAGTGSLLNNIFNLSPFVGCAIFCFLVCFMAFKGIDGVIKLFSYVIPFLVITTLIICVVAISKYGIQIERKNTNTNPLLINWWFSAINYVSYNIISLIGTVIPIAMFVKKRKTAYSGIFLGCLIALSLATGIVLAVTSMFNTIQSDLPMLDIAFALGNIWGYVYAVLLLCAMFGTSLACLAGTIEYIKEKFSCSVKNEKIINISLGGLTYICSLAGFGTLVGVVYPIFGYIGFGVLFFIIHSYLKLLKNSGMFK